MRIARRRAPDRLVGELEEVHVEVEQRPVPALLAVDAVRDELRQRHLEHPDDLARVGRQRRSSGQEPDERRDREARRDGADARRAAPRSRRRRDRGRSPRAPPAAPWPRRSASTRRIELAARERDLALVRRHRLGALDEHDAGLAVRFEQRHEHRRGHAARAPGHAAPRRAARRRAGRGPRRA